MTKTSTAFDRWRRRFMLLSATQAALQGPRFAVDHSLRKWEGLRPAVLARYGLTQQDVVHTGCALCTLDDLHAPVSGTGSCRHCPLYAVLGHACDDDDRSPYAVWRETDNTTPMLEALERTKAALLDGSLTADVDGIWHLRQP